MKITYYNIVKGIRFLKNYGLKAFLVRVGERLEPEEVAYGPWYEKHQATPEALQLQRERSDAWERRPLISICVPLYCTPEHFFDEMVQSVLDQSYRNWQLCLADGTPDDSVKRMVQKYLADDRIKYQHLGENLGIAENTNAAFAMADGDWIGLLDHDDLLARDALYEVLNMALYQGGRTINGLKSDAECEVVYTDEDKVSEDSKIFSQPHFKPDINLDLLRSNNYITHFFCVKRSVVEKAGGFRKEFDGAQDYDFIFRCLANAGSIAHVPRILYHWRVSRTSTADNPESKLYAFAAGRRAIQAHLQAWGQEAAIRDTSHMGFYELDYACPNEVLISILIPNKDQSAMLKQCLDSIAKSTYQHYEIVIVENNSEQPETFAYYEELVGQKYVSGQALEGTLADGKRICVVTWGADFNYSAINNFGVRYTHGKYLLFLNNDIELITNDWLERMLSNCSRPEVGAVGVKLLYEDNTVQHAGIVIGIGGIASNMLVGLKRERDGYLNKASVQLNYSAVTAACMMVKRSAFDTVGGFDETLAVAFNDVDLCLKLRELGLLIVYNPQVLAYHYESKSRGLEDTREKVERFGQEIDCFKQKWSTIIEAGDPYYNPNFTLNKSNYSYKQSMPFGHKSQ